jgi:hypothetical protein
MKKKYEEFVFYLIPVNYLMNNEVKNEYTFRTEVVSVKVKKPVNMILNNRLEMEIKHNLNNIISVVEGDTKLKVDKVKIKYNQPLVSGILFE